MMVGAQVAIYPRFSVSNFWPEIERTGANDVGLLAAMMPMLANAPDNDAMKRCFGQVKGVWGAPFALDTQKIWKERFGAIHTVAGGFGLSECSLPTILPFGTPAKPNSSGRRNTELFDVRIVDDNDVELPPNTPGEIIVRPRQPHVMFEGYWRRPEDTLKVMRNMWFHTGDIGMFDEDDYFFFMDRKKDYLRRRGENISSFEVEAAFRQHEAIDEVAAHAVLSDLGEDELKVTIILKSGITLDPEALCAWSADQMPYYAVPRYIEFRSELPKSPLGRVFKYQLRDEGVTPTTWDREKAGFKLAKR
jgi:crotonobetaine/carnitine-CoA ligase